MLLLNLKVLVWNVYHTVSSLWTLFWAEQLLSLIDFEHSVPLLALFNKFNHLRSWVPLLLLNGLNWFGLLARVEKRLSTSLGRLTMRLEIHYLKQVLDCIAWPYTVGQCLACAEQFSSHSVLEYELGFITIFRLNKYSNFDPVQQVQVLKVLLICLCRQRCQSCDDGQE